MTSFNIDGPYSDEDRQFLGEVLKDPDFPYRLPELMIARLPKKRGPKRKLGRMERTLYLYIIDHMKKNTKETDKSVVERLINDEFFEKFFSKKRLINLISESRVMAKKGELPAITKSKNN